MNTTDEDELVTAMRLFRLAVESQADGDATVEDILLSSVGCVGFIAIIFIVLLAIWL